jgi:hypothetical protein
MKEDAIDGVVVKAGHLGEVSGRCNTAEQADDDARYRADGAAGVASSSQGRTKKQRKGTK